MLQPDPSEAAQRGPFITTWKDPATHPKVLIFPFRAEFRARYDALLSPATSKGSNQTVSWNVHDIKDHPRSGNLFQVVMLSVSTVQLPPSLGCGHTRQRNTGGPVRAVWGLEQRGWQFKNGALIMLTDKSDSCLSTNEQNSGVRLNSSTAASTPTRLCSPCATGLQMLVHHDHIHHDRFDLSRTYDHTSWLWYMPLNRERWMLPLPRSLSTHLRFLVVLPAGSVS